MWGYDMNKERLREEFNFMCRERIVLASDFEELAVGILVCSGALDLMLRAGVIGIAEYFRLFDDWIENGKDKCIHVKKFYFDVSNLL